MSRFLFRFDGDYLTIEAVIETAYELNKFIMVFQAQRHLLPEKDIHAPPAPGDEISY